MSRVRRLGILFSFLISIPGSGCAADSPASSAPPPTAEEKSSRIVCGSVPLTKRPLDYCYQDRANQGSRAEPKVIYYFHGLGGSENEIFESHLAFILDGLASQLGAEMPIIVGLSLGAGGVMGYEANDVALIGLAQIERRFAPGKSPRRFVMGASMGGHNSLRLASVGSSRFVGLAGLCPAMATFNAHDSTQVASYVARHRENLDIEFFNRALAVYKRELPTAEAWEDNNPFNSLPRGAFDGLPIFLSVGTEDTLGFYEGVREFDARGDLRPGMSVETREVPGGHCAFDVEGFFRFVVESFQDRTALLAAGDANL